MHRRGPCRVAPARWWWSSGDDAADLEIDDRIHVEADRLEDLVAVLVELGRALRRMRCATELHRRGDELERRALGGGAVADVAVGDGLRVVRGFEGVLDHGPLPG